MRKSRFTDSQIMAMLKQNEDGAAVNDIYREHSVSSAQFYKWRSKYGGMDASMVKRLKELEEENARLKKMYAEEKLISEIRKEAIEKSSKAISAQGDGPESSRAVRQVSLQPKTGFTGACDLERMWTPTKGVLFYA